MRILIAEDEENILRQYRIILEARGHEVVVTRNGQQCIEEYTKLIEKNEKGYGSSGVSPFDAVVLDYRMPKMDGMDVAKNILKMCSKQRIIFASAFVKETLIESIKELDQIVELLQKPFEIDVLVETVEDTTIFQQLEKLKVDIAHLKDWNPSHAQVRDLLDGLLKLRKPGFHFQPFVGQQGGTAYYPHGSQPAG